MDIKHYVKPTFYVIGKEGTTNDGQGFIQRLWEEASGHFNEVSTLTKKDASGNIVGCWGVMTDMNYTFMPWEENFSKGRYLAGVEVDDEAKAPAGWSKWQVPGYEYLVVESEGSDTFSNMIAYMNMQGIQLVGAVHDFTNPTDGKNYMFFPIKKL